MNIAEFLATASGLLALPSTADRPAELERALDYMIDFVGTGFTVERFSSAGKPSALIYRAPEGKDRAPEGKDRAPEGKDRAPEGKDGARPRFRGIFNAHL